MYSYTYTYTYAYTCMCIYHTRKLFGDVYAYVIYMYTRM